MHSRVQDGVGDSADSFAYDGNRLKKWNGAPSDYGEAWATGDVIGCCIDLDEGRVVFYRNGKSLGPAFENIPRNIRGLAHLITLHEPLSLYLSLSLSLSSTRPRYFPGISISSGETAITNFGAWPFDHPVEGYRPLQPPPPRATLSRARYLVSALRGLVPLAASGSFSPAKGKVPLVLLCAEIP